MVNDANEKRDMSDVCGFLYERSWVDGTIEAYYGKYCSKCVHICEICMYGEAL